MGGRGVGPPTTLSALLAAVAPGQQQRGLSAHVIRAMRSIAARHGLRELIAPVRPTLKAQYPLIPIDRYVAWRREDGSHFDPWIRVHERVGGRILAPAPVSMTIDCPVADWEEWTGMRFPENGTYVFPGALAPLEVSDGIGRHVEPNVWLRHAV